MAGTRLLIQATVAAQFLLLVTAALYFGLCQQGDEICLLLFGSKDRRLVHAIESMPSKIDVPVVSVVVPDSDEMKWKNSIDTVVSRSAKIEVVTDKHLSGVCSENDGAIAYAKLHDVWQCPETLDTHGEKANDVVARVKVLPGGTSLVFPRRIDEKLAETLFTSPPTPLHRKLLRFTLVVLDGKSWQAWSQALAHVVESLPFSNLPCLKSNPSMKMVLNDGLGEGARLVKRDNVTVYEISPRDLQPYLSSTETSDDSTLNVFIHVPRHDKMPLAIRQGQHVGTSAFVALKSMSSIVSQIPNEDQRQESYNEIIRLALEKVIPFLHSNCLGLPPNHAMLMVEPSGAFASWQLTLSLQRLLVDTHESAVNDWKRAFHFIMASSSSVDPTGQASQGLLDASTMIKQGIEFAHGGQWDLALEKLETSILQTRHVLADPNLMEPLDFPLEHAFAIFGPLLFPLVIPLVVGLMREIKRYKKMQKAKSL